MMKSILLAVCLGAVAVFAAPSPRDLEREANMAVELTKKSTDHNYNGFPPDPERGLEREANMAEEFAKKSTDHNYNGFPPDPERGLEREANMAVELAKKSINYAIDKLMEKENLEKELAKKEQEPEAAVMAELRQLIESELARRSAVEALFKQADTDNDGFITMEEVKVWYKNNPTEMAGMLDAAIEKQVTDADTNGDGKIDLAELTAAQGR